MISKRLCMFFLTLLWTFSATAETGIILEDGRILRALPRPLSKLYSQPDTNSAVLDANVRAFWPVYVFERKNVDFSDPARPKGWYKVGIQPNQSNGWMPAKDILEWKQALVVSFTHPGVGDEQRKPVLMFKSKAMLGDVVDAYDREELVDSIYTQIQQQANSPLIVSQESPCFVDIEENFYILPVIDFEEIDLFDDEAKYLQIASAVPQNRADESKPDILANLDFDPKMCQAKTQQLSFDIKFVMDMTGSMGPYIKGTKQVITDLAKDLASTYQAVEVNYGLIGYRDDLKYEPHQGFVVKNFTPQLVKVDQLIKVLAQAKPTKNLSGDYQEEVFAGIKEAITSNWRNNSRKFIIVIGDASSHDLSHVQNTSGMNAEQIRELANTNEINILSIYLTVPRYQQDNIIAEPQFSQLATNPGSESLPLYMDVAASNHAEFKAIVKNIVDTFSQISAAINQNDVDTVQQGIELSEISGLDSSEKARRMAQIAAVTSLVTYLGKESTPPRDITPWVMDRDLMNPEMLSLQVRALLKKSELNDVLLALETILKAVKRAKVTGMQFFQALQGVIAQSSKGELVSVAGAKKLSDSGILPTWINTLPYRSAVLNMSDDMFEALSAQERSNLELDIESKITLYQELNRNNDVWIKLDQRDSNLDAVYPLRLTALP